jgi:hypothetical protein
MHRLLVALLVLTALASTAFPQTVTLPLDDYDKLKSPDRPEDITVVDTLLLAGAFKDRSLKVTFSGRSVGKRAATNVLNTSSGLLIWGCSGNAVISRGDDAFRITPLADSFTATCKIAAPGSDRLELTGTRDVLAIASSVTDGELVAGEASSDGTQTYSLVRQSAGGAENIPPTATGHYLITLLPDETRFRYAIEVHNPNRTRRPFEVRLRSGEHLQQVDAVAPYEVVDGAYRFDLPPGDTNLVLTGQLTGDAFTPPVEASLQYLAIENHPIVRPLIDGAVKRISAAEAGVPTQFRGPQAFLLGKGETLRWKTAKLEALHTVSYALSGAKHTFFIPIDGNVLGESTFVIDNQGASDVKLPLQPEPTYVSIENEALLMTKGGDGKLTVPLSAGKQQLLVQHRQGIRHILGFGAGRLVVPQLGVPATRLDATINYPRQWIPLMQSFSTRTRFWTPSASLVLIFLGLLVWTERLLAWLAMPLRKRMTVAILVAAASSAFDPVAALFALGDLFLTITWLIPHLKKETWTLFKGLAVTGVILVILLAIVADRQNVHIAPPVSQAPVSSYEVRTRANVNLPAAESPKDDVGNGAGLSYQGLPARFEIPSGDRQSTFSQELLSTDRERAISVVLVSSTLVWLAGMMLVALAAWSLWRSREALATGVRTRLAPAAPVAA